MGETMKSDEIKTQRVSNNRVSSIGRRRFLSALVGTGFSLSAAAYLTPEDVAAAAKDEVPIPYAVVADDRESDSPSYSAKKQMVPADWYNDLRRAEKVYENSDFLQRKGSLVSFSNLGSSEARTLPSRSKSKVLRTVKQLFIRQMCGAHFPNRSTVCRSM